MATVTHAATAIWTTAAGNKASNTFTPVKGDLLVVIAPATGVATTIVTDNNGTGGVYTKVGASFTGFSTAGDLSVWVRTSLVTSTATTTVTVTQTASTGGGVDVYRVAGITRTGLNAIRSSGGQSAGTLGTTPAPVLSLTPLTGNPIITAVCNGTNPSGITIPTGYTAAPTNLNYLTPTTSLIDTFVNSGITNATITWGSTSATAFASVAVELDTSTDLAVTPLPQPGSNAWRQRFRKTQQYFNPVNALPPVTCTGSLSLAPLAFAGQGSVSPWDTPQVQPGEFWLQLFKPQLPKPFRITPAAPPALPPVTSTGSFALAPLTFSKNANVAVDAVGPVSPPFHSTSGGPGYSWTHACGASATYLLVAFATDAGTPASFPSLAVTYAGTPMALLKQWISGGPTESAGFLSVFGLANPAAGSNTVAISNGGSGATDGGSISFTGAASLGAAVASDNNAPVNGGVSSGSVVVTGTAASSLVAAFVGNGSGFSGFNSGVNPFTSPAVTEWDALTGGGNACGGSGGAVQAAGGSVTVAWGQTNDWYAAIAVEVKAAFAAGQGSVSSFDQPQIFPGPAWLNLFKHKQLPFLGQQAIAVAGVSSSGSFSLAPLAFAAQGNQTSPDVTQILPGPFWFQLFKPGSSKPPIRTPYPSGTSSNSTGSFALAPLAFSAQGNQTSPDVTQITPGTTWLRLFKRAVPKPVPVPPAFQAVSGTVSFSLAPLAFAAAGNQTSPDVTQIQPGPFWFQLFKPDQPKPFRPLWQGLQAVNATGSFALAPLAFAASGAQTSPDVPQVNPGSTWLSLFKHKPLPQDLPAPPSANLVTTTGSFAFAPLAFTGQGNQTSPDQPQVQPGPLWLRLFRPNLYKPLPPPPAQQSANGTASFTLAPLAFSAQGNQTSPDVPQILPGTTWFDLFKPWFPRPRPVPPAFQGVNGTASFTLAPLAFAAQGSQTSPDLPQAQPGPVWLRLFKPAQAKPVPWIPSAPFIGVQGEASFALAPLAFAAQGSATSPDLPQIVPGTTWLSWFKHRQRPVVPALGPVTASGSLSLAPLAFLAQGNQSSPDVPQIDPGAFWLRLFKPWVQKPVPPLPARDQVSTSGSFSLASLKFTASAAQSSPDVPQISPGTTWLSLFKRKPRPVPPAFQGVNGTASFNLAPLAFNATGLISTIPGSPLQVAPGPGWLLWFKHWQRPIRPDALPTHINTAGGIALGTFAFLGESKSPRAVIRLGVPYLRWITGSPKVNWRIPS